MFKFRRYIDWSELYGLLVGAVLAVAICFAIFIIIAKLQQEGIVGKKEYRLYSDLVSGQGLRKGTIVQINGVGIGSVEDISLTDKGLVRLKFILDLKYRHWITNKSVVYATRDQNIISERVVNIDISQKGDRILEDEEFLIAGTAKDIETVLKTANELINSVDKLVTTAGVVLEMIKDTNTTVGMLLGDGALLYKRLDLASVRLNGLLLDADKLIGGVNKGIPTITSFADSLSSGVMGLMGNLNDLTGRASVLVNSLDTTMRGFGNMVNELNGMIGEAGNVLSDGSQTLNRTDDFIGGASKIWFLRSKIPQKDSIPLLEEAW
ncbi:MAG: MlaD family protein [Candidatus Fibromonas sp.]|jgi:phospholipid/cholesterol/gamma-HCH transport system substrate-binding protein|nr:MlaD family protein [Candidatus Fibromonas sp.]